uniref:Uncharacterized protein n=1 Tax=Arundo donax TaxID=35708 RepID=A0A0A9HMC8_ARUDO
MTITPYIKPEKSRAVIVTEQLKANMLIARRIPKSTGIFTLEPDRTNQFFSIECATKDHQINPAEYM